MRCRRLPQLLAPLALFAVCGGFTASITPLANATQDQNAEAFYRAFYLESGLRDFTAAEKAYTAIAVATDPKAKAYVVPAMIGRARCLQSLGKPDEARKALDAALAIDPNNVEARRLADKRADDGIDPELAQSLGALVSKLGGAERQQAFSDLGKIGDVKLPFLEVGLRSRDIAVVESCAQLLGIHGSAAAILILANAYRDPRVSFPTALRSCFSSLRSSSDALEVVEAAFESSDPSIREDAIQWAKVYSHPKNSVDPDRFVTLFRRALKDAAPVAGSLAGFWDCDPRIVKALVPDLVPWLRTLGVEHIDQAIKSARRLDPPIPEIDAFAREQLESPNPDLVESALKWLEQRIEMRAIDPTEATTLLLKRVAAFDRNSKDASAILSKVDATATRPVDAEIHRLMLEAIERADVVVANDVFSRLLTLSMNNKTLTESRLVEYFVALDAQWPRIGSTYGNIFVGGLINGVRSELPGEANARQFAIGRFRATSNAELQKALYSAMRAANVYEYSSQVATAVLESPHESIRALYYAAISQPTFNWRDSAVTSQVALANVLKDLDSTSESIAANARTVAWNLASPIFAPAAKAQLDRATPATRAAALDFYARCAGKDAIPALEAALANPDSDGTWTIAQHHLVRVGDESVMARIAKTAGTNEIRLKAIMELFEKRRDEPQLVARRAEALITALEPDQFRDYMFKSLTNVFPAGHYPLVERGLTATDASARLAACQLAWYWCTEAAEPKLLSMLEHDTPQVSAAAQEALDAIRSRRDLRNATKLALGFDRSQSISDARALLASDDPVKRRGGALALGALGDLSAIPSLLKLLDDKDATVRESALTALGKLQSAPPTSSSGKSTPAKDGEN